MMEFIKDCSSMHGYMSAILETANPRLIFFIVFTAGLAYLMYRDRKNVERHSILFYRRTERGLDLIDRIAERFPRFWNFYGWTGLVIGLLSIPFVLLNIVISFSQMFEAETGGGPSIVAPGLTGETTFQSGISFVPVEYWVIGIGILMVVHEMSHGIVARAEDMEINSVGWIVLGIIPGAFVEPKGENMLPEKGKDGEIKEADAEGDGLWDQGSLTSQLKVLAAGSFANYITAVVMTVAALGIFLSVAQPVGVAYMAEDDLPAQQAGLNNGTMYSINGEQVRYGSDVQSVMQQYQANETITVNTSEGEFNVTLMEREGEAHMGVMMSPGEGLTAAFFDMVNDNREIKEEYEDYSGFLGWLLGGLQIVALLNFLIGLFNMLPIRPLDGGQIVAAIIGHYTKDGETAVNYISLLGWAVILSAIVLSIATGL